MPGAPEPAPAQPLRPPALGPARPADSTPAPIRRLAPRPGLDDAPAPPRTPSIVTRLTTYHGISLFLLCGLISLFLDASTISALGDDLRSSIEAEARQVGAVILGSADPVRALEAHLRTIRDAAVKPRVAVRVREGDAVVAHLEESERILPAAAPFGPLPSPLAGGTATAAYGNARPGELRKSWEYAYGEVVTADGRRFRIEVFGHRSDIDRFMLRFRWRLILLVSPLMLAAIVAARIYLRRTVAPLRSVTAAAARIGSRTLGERLDVRRAPAEISRLVGSFNDMLDRLEDAFRRLQEFGGDLAHELRTPLQNVRGQAEVALLHERTPKQYRESLGGIVEECDRLARIIDDVLLLSRVERQEEALEVARFDLAQELESIREYFEMAAASRDVTLTGEGAGPLEIEGDRLKLRRALANLVDNAIKYSEARGTVEIRARRLASGGVEVLVADTGRGIAAEHLPRLFERFYRVDKSRSRHTGGAGLGLGIARTIVRAHGGDVRLESEEGKGTRAIVTLPAPTPRG